MSKNLGSVSCTCPRRMRKFKDSTPCLEYGIPDENCSVHRAKPVLVGWMRKESEQAAGLFLLYQFLAFVTETDCQSELGKLEIDW